MLIKPIKTSLFNINDDLFLFITKYIKKFNEYDILVITSKIVALSQGCVIPHDSYTKYMNTVSAHSVKTPWAILTLTSEGWCINAGVDESNVRNGYVTLPENPFEYAHILRKRLRKKYGLKNLGVIITDTRSVPLRAGTVGRAIGCAGFHPLKSYIGKKDLFGRKSRVTVSNNADALATGAVFVMGEGSEQTPLAVIQNAPVRFTQKKLPKKETRLFLLPREDIFTYLYRAPRKYLKDTP